MKKTPQYFECLRLRADCLAYRDAAQYYKDKLKNLDKDSDDKRKGNYLYLSTYCSIKSEELQLRAIEKLETEPEWRNSMSHYTACDWNKDSYGKCRDGMFTMECEHNTKDTNNK